MTNASRFLGSFSRMKAASARALRASGDRVQPATTTRTLSRRTIHVRGARYIFVTSLGLLRKIFVKGRIHRLNILDQAVRGIGNTSIHWACDSDKSSVGAVAEDRAVHHLNAGDDLPRDRLPLRLIPIQHHLLCVILLDQITIDGDRSIRRWQWDSHP